MADPKPKRTLLDLSREPPPPPPPSTTSSNIPDLPPATPSNLPGPSNPPSDLPRTNEIPKSGDKKETQSNKKSPLDMFKKDKSEKPATPKDPAKPNDPPSSETKKPETTREETKKPEKKGLFAKMFGKDKDAKKDKEKDKSPGQEAKPEDTAASGTSGKTDEGSPKDQIDASRPEPELPHVAPKEPDPPKIPVEPSLPTAPETTEDKKVDIRPDDGGGTAARPLQDEDARKGGAGDADVRYPMPGQADDEKPSNGEAKKDEGKEETKPKPPEKKKGGFFDNLFGKKDEEEEPSKEDEGKDGEPTEKESEGKMPDEKTSGEEEKKKEEDGGFFGGLNKLFKKHDEEPPLEDKKKPVEEKKEEKSGFFSGFNKIFKKDEEEEDKKPPAPADDQHLEVKESDEKDAEKKEDKIDDDDDLKDEPGEDDGEEVLIEDEVVKEKKVSDKPKPKKPAIADVKDGFESGDACLAAKVGRPYSKTLTFDRKINSRFGGNLTNCERLLGVIPAKFAEHHENKSNPEAIRGIYVWGVVPRGPADKAGAGIGDWIMEINDVNIHSGNFEEVLKNVESENLTKIQLKLQKVLLCFDSSGKPQKTLKSAEPSNISYPALVAKLSGHEVNFAQKTFELYPHSILFLKNHIRSKDLQEFDAKEDVIYSYPNNPSQNGLLDFRGSFLTLQSLVPFLSGSEVDSTSLLHRNQQMLVAHQASQNGLLLIGLPASRCSRQQLQRYRRDIGRLLELLFSSVEKAFSDDSNHRRLDDLFCTTFSKLFSSGEVQAGSRFGEAFFGSSPCARSTLVDVDVKMRIDEHLNDLEAESFGHMSEDYYGSRKVSRISGSAFYYKGYLVSSQIPYDRVQDVHLILKYNNVLNNNNTEQLGHNYLWTEVFFDNNGNKTKRMSVEHSKDIRQFDVYRRFGSTGERSFILALSAFDSLLVTLLNCGEETFDLLGKRPSVDLFMLNRLKFTMSRLVASGVTNSMKDIQPSLSNVEEFLMKPESKTMEKMSEKLKRIFKKKKDEQKLSTPPRQNLGSSQSDLSNPKHLYTRQMSDSNLYLRKQFEDGEKFDEADFDASSLQRDGNFPSQASSVDKTSSSSRLQLNRISDETNETPRPRPSPPVRLNSGPKNTVFNYALVDAGNNIIIAPPWQQTLCRASLTQVEVMSKFYESCSVIRNVFNNSQKLFGQPVIEHGVLFHCNKINPRGCNKDSNHQLTYWTVGRKVDQKQKDGSEFYVCFHDSAEQNVVEMAFKLLRSTYVS